MLPSSLLAISLSDIWQAFLPHSQVDHIQISLANQKLVWFNVASIESQNFFVKKHRIGENDSQVNCSKKEGRPIIIEFDLQFMKISLWSVNFKKKVKNLFSKSQQPLAAHSKHYMGWSNAHFKTYRSSSQEVDSIGLQNFCKTSNRKSYFHSKLWKQSRIQKNMSHSLKATFLFVGHHLTVWL